MPITYGDASNAVRTRLPGTTDTVTSGEAARDTDDRFGGLVPLQMKTLENVTFTSPLFVSMPRKPAFVVCGVTLAQDPETGTTALGGVVACTWKGDGISVRAIPGITSGSGIRYNLTFLGVG